MALNPHVQEATIQNQEENVIHGETLVTFPQDFREPENNTLPQEQKQTDDKELRAKFEEIQLIYTINGTQLDYSEYRKNPQHFNLQAEHFENRLQGYIEENKPRIDEMVAQDIKKTKQHVSHSLKQDFKQDATRKIYNEFFQSELKNSATGNLQEFIAKFENIQTLNAKKLTTKENRPYLDLLRRNLQMPADSKISLEQQLNQSQLTIGEFINQPQIRRQLFENIIKSPHYQKMALAMAEKIKHDTQMGGFGGFTKTNKSNYEFSVVGGFKESPNQPSFGTNRNQTILKNHSTEPAILAAGIDGEKLVNASLESASADRKALLEKREKTVDLAIKQALKAQNKKRSYFKDFLNGFEDRDEAAKITTQKIKQDYAQTYMIEDIKDSLGGQALDNGNPMIAVYKEKFLDSQLTEMVDIHSVIGGIRKFQENGSQKLSPATDRFSSVGLSNPLDKSTKELVRGMEYLTKQYYKSSRSGELQSVTEKLQDTLNRKDLSPALKMSALISAKNNLGIPLSTKEDAFQQAEQRFDKAFNLGGEAKEPLFTKFEYEKSKNNFIAAEHQQELATRPAETPKKSFWGRVFGRKSDESQWHQDKQLPYSGGIEIRKVEGLENVYEARRKNSDGKDYIAMGQYTLESKVKGVKTMVAFDETAKNYEEKNRQAIALARESRSPEKEPSKFNLSSRDSRQKPNIAAWRNKTLGRS